MGYFNDYKNYFIVAAFNVLLINIATVNAQTQPGTGVIIFQTISRFLKSASQ
jgi:hypothetical protein